MRFLHFSNNKNEPDMTDENYKTMWETRTTFGKLNDAYAKYCSPTEHTDIDELTELFKGRVIFKQSIPKKHKRFGIKIYKLCDSKGYTYMSAYLGRDRTCVTATMTTSHATVSGHIARN
jgi:hypothetical protein